MKLLFSVIFSFVSFCPVVAGEMPKEVSDAIVKLGPVINAPETAKLFAPLQQMEPYGAAVVVRDESYGPDPRNRLDVFKPTPSVGSRPVLIFVHGGGYERGDKRGSGSPYYDNVMLWAVANGMVGVNMTYRLAPTNPWPAARDDVAAAVVWTKANVARFGGDGSRILLMGHSAGATHVASYLTQTEEKSDIKGAILISGTYDLKPEIEVPGQKSYFGADPALWSQRSSLKGLAGSQLRLFVAHGEIDVPYYIGQAEGLKTALCANNRCPTFAVLKGQSHMSEIYGLNTSDTTLSDQLAAFVSSAEKK